MRTREPRTGTELARSAVLPTEDRATRDTQDDRAGFRVSPRVLVAPQGRYQRGREIARGGIGRVTTARDQTLQREVAIKELHERTEHAARRFVRESLTTARLQHPAIVPVFDAGTWDSGDPYLVMKLLEGKTLAANGSATAT